MTDPEVYAQVLERDQYQCAACGQGGLNQLHVHHVTYRSRGGDDVLNNLVTLCLGCHQLLHDNPAMFHIVWNGQTFDVFKRRQSS